MNKKILVTSLLALSIHSAADSLLDIYNDALENDPQYKSAEFSYLAGKEIKVQGRAGLLPNISISAQTNWNEYYQNGDLQNEYNNFSSSARLTQPLIRLDSWFKYRQSKFLTDAAEADFAYSQQALIVRTAELYFNVLRAIDNLSAARSEEKAIKKQLDQIRQRYEVGLAAVTEVQEAQLAFDLSLASRTRVEGEVYTAKEALNALVGREILSLDGLVNDLNVTNPVPASKEEWARKAVENNFRLQAANLRKFASKNNARSVASNHLPKVDIVGVQTESETNQYAFDGLNTGGAFNITVPDETQRDTYSLQLSMPIFQGGAVISRTKQAYAESNKSSEDALFTERSVIQDVRSQYSNVVTLVANLRAQKQAVVSASSALEATKVGYEVGTRNIVDLLQAEKNLYSAERNLSNAKYDYLITTLRLHLAAGTLSPENLIEINNLLG
ncbi:TolC family outer membrane protein [Gammaproteobacteria bacterium]|jgi:outer membrane protein|nr:TolC family outer membrane protein [Gammaproteobacteria bacterium]MDB2629270.1 TolC family outer membrane protein [Gammaproteobacteria bacterium]